MRPHTSYIICCTPRSGSWLLSETLEGTGIAGRPKEYFMREHEQIWSQRWGVSHYPDYLTRVLEAGTTPNGVFGVKAHWYQFADVPAKLRQLPGYKAVATPDALAQLLPNLRYIWLTRQDKVRQAISYAQALQTKAWWKIDGPIDKTTCIPPIIEEPNAPPKTAQFDATEIGRLLKLLKAHDAAWERYFVREGITPLVIAYEDLAEAYESTIRRILRHLNISTPERLVLSEPRLKKQADSQSEQWVRRYRESQQALADIDHAGQEAAGHTVNGTRGVRERMQDVTLCVHWDLGGCTPTVVDCVQQRLQVAIPAAEHNDLVRVTGDFIQVQLKAGPYGLVSQTLQTGIAAFSRARERVTAAMPVEVAWTETTSLFFRNSGRIIELETLSAIAEVAAPSLLLLGQQDGEPLVLDIAGDILRLAIPSALRADLIAQLIPFLVALLAAFIRDEPLRALPPNLLWHPHMSVDSDNGQRMTIAQRYADGTAILPQGRLTWLWGETREGTPMCVTAQQSLTDLFLYVENDMCNLTGDEALNLLQQMGQENVVLPLNKLCDIARPQEVPRAGQ